MASRSASIIRAKKLAVAGPDLKHDARSYFATGAALQELYLTPKLMSAAGWDEVAAGAKWSRANFDVLTDSHWIGGDPAKNEIYGYASWSPRKAIFMLRNPSDKVGTISVDAAQIFELPDGAKRRFKLSSPYQDQRTKSGELRAGVAHEPLNCSRLKCWFWKRCRSKAPLQVLAEALESFNPKSRSWRCR